MNFRGVVTLNEPDYMVGTTNIALVNAVNIHKASEDCLLRYMGFYQSKLP
ncbi:MAG: hypothetical protein RRZ24_10235 [Clostridia bacterium]